MPRPASFSFRRVGLALLGVFAVLSAMALSGCLSRALLYPAPGIAVPKPRPPLEEVELRTASGQRIVAWAYAPPKADPGSPVLLYFHGNGENLKTVEMAGVLDHLKTLELPFLVLDYPGYGRSSGKPSEKGILEAADAAVAWCGDRKAIPFGWSLGAAVAVQAAVRHSDQVQALVLCSPWTSLHEVAKVHYPPWLVWMILRDQYDSLAAAPTIRCPCLVLHGEMDEAIPFSHGKRLSEALPAGRWVPVTEGWHNDMLDRPQVWEAIRAFLKDLKLR